MAFRTKISGTNFLQYTLTAIYRPMFNRTFLHVTQLYRADKGKFHKQFHLRMTSNNVRWSQCRRLEAASTQKPKSTKMPKYMNVWKWILFVTIWNFNDHPTERFKSLNVYLFACLHFFCNVSSENVQKSLCSVLFAVCQKAREVDKLSRLKLREVPFNHRYRPKWKYFFSEDEWKTDMRTFKLINNEKTALASMYMNRIQ